MSSMSSSSNSTSNAGSNSGTADDGVKPQDAQTSSEKIKAQRDAKKAQVDQVRTTDLDLKNVETRQKYYLQQAEKDKKDTVALQNKLKQLKGAPKTTIPAGGTVVENIRKMRD